MARTEQKERVSQGLGPKTTGGVTHLFTRAASRVSEFAGHHWTFVVMLALVVGWAVTGPLFGFSDTWQLAANTGTTIITFLMVFIIQNTQNRDAKATQLKLDELLRAVLERARRSWMSRKRTSRRSRARRRSSTRMIPIRPGTRQRTELRR
jgi:low affinity Fe/Cu permease